MLVPRAAVMSASAGDKFDLATSAAAPYESPRVPLSTECVIPGEWGWICPPLPLPNT